MAPQTHIPTSANVLGTIGTICWCVQLVPQIWRNWRTKSTEGLPTTMMFMWCISGVSTIRFDGKNQRSLRWSAKPIDFRRSHSASMPSSKISISRSKSNHNASASCAGLAGVSVSFTHGKLLTLSLSRYCCLTSTSKWRTLNVTLLFLTLLTIFAGIQTGLIFAIRPAYANGTTYPVLIIGVLAFILLISGYLPIPFELLKRRGRVVGIDFVFLTIDWFGAFFSLMSLVVQTEFDVMFGTLYALCCAIEMGMVVSHLIWKVRVRGLRKRARESGVKFDEFPEAVEWQAKGIDVEAKLRGLFGRKSGDRKTGAMDKVDNEEVCVEGGGKGAEKATVPNVVL